MLCSTCSGKGIVPVLHSENPTPVWDGRERRRQPRWISNADLQFREAVPAARYQSCPDCEGSGKRHPNLLRF
jgi:hypothetical protein